MILLPIKDKSPGTIAVCTTSNERREFYDTAFEPETAPCKDENNESSE